jgi:hypothetical protein
MYASERRVTRFGERAVDAQQSRLGSTTESAAPPYHLDIKVVAKINDEDGSTL